MHINTSFILQFKSVECYSKNSTYLCWAKPKASSNLDLQSWQTKSPILLSILANFSFASSVTSTTLYSGSMSPKNVTYKFHNWANALEKNSIRINREFNLKFLPVWYIGISSPSANSLIKVPDTGELLSSSKVSLRETRFLADTIRQSKKHN